MSRANLSQDAALALWAGTQFRRSNDLIQPGSVVIGGELRTGIVWKYHGNAIAIRLDSPRSTRGGEVWVSDANHQTTTTKRRLSAIPGVTVVQRNFDWYLTAPVRPEGRWDGTWTRVI